MSNMSYCRFRNTLEALQDCFDYFGDTDLSEEEESASSELITLCKELAEKYAYILEEKE